MTKPEPISQEELDHLIDQFASLMKREMKANAYKGTWRNDSPEAIFMEIIYHFGKLAKAIRIGEYPRIQEFSVDTANLLMMYLDLRGLLFYPQEALPYDPNDFLSRDFPDDDLSEMYNQMRRDDDELNAEYWAGECDDA